MSGRYLYSNAFCPSTADMNGFELAALYTLQDCLPRDAEQIHGFEHFHVTFGRIFNEERTQFLRHAYAPRRAGRHLLAGNEAIIEPAMQGRRCEPQSLRGALDAHAVAGGRVLCGLEALDLPVRAQAADAIRGKRQTSGGGTALAIEDAG